MTAEYFWKGMASLVAEFAPRIETALARRDGLQVQIDERYRANRGAVSDVAAEIAFLKSIGYLVPEPDAFTADTANVDAELCDTPGPQLVVPITNARYALNAANARWGSLYDALYGTDAIDEAEGAERTAQFNPKRGAKVIAYARAFLDDNAPLAHGA